MASFALYTLNRIVSAADDPDDNGVTVLRVYPRTRIATTRDCHGSDDQPIPAAHVDQLAEQRLIECQQSREYATHKAYFYEVTKRGRAVRDFSFGVGQ